MAIIEFVKPDPEIGVDIIDVFNDTAYSMKKVHLNIGKNALKKAKKLYQIYNIPTDEKILAYCKKHFLGVTVNGCVFTNKAFYPRPEFLNSQPSRGDLMPMRIDYLDFCKYLIIQSGEKSAVYMRNSQKSYLLCFETLINKNVLGCEIRAMLLAIQERLCKESTKNTDRLNNIAKIWFDKAQAELKIGNLLSDTDDTLKGLVYMEQFRVRSIYLLAENMYRLCNKDKYCSFITSYSNYMSEDEKQRLINIPREFKENFASDLSNPNLMFANDYMHKILNNLKSSEKTEENLKHYIFACIRTNKMFEARLQIRKLIQQFGRKAAYITEDFACIYGNKKMQAIVELINDNQDISEDDYGVIDGLGFSPLHYAIILNNEKAIRQLAASKKFIGYMKYNENEEINDLFAYTTPAFVKKIELRGYVALCTSLEIIQLSNDRCALEKQIEKANIMIEKLKRESGKLTHKRNVEFVKDLLHGHINLDEDTPEDEVYYEAQRNYRESIQELEHMRLDIDEKIQEIKNLIKEKGNIIVKETLQTIKRLENSRNSFIGFIMDLYKNNADNIVIKPSGEVTNTTEILIQIYKSEHIISRILDEVNNAVDFRIYEYDGFFFMLPDSIELNLPYRKVHVTDKGILDEYIENEIVNHANYGNSWFSPDAHINKNVLKREYRALVKQYHPDIGKDKFPKEFFIEIQNEYETLSNML